MTWNPKNLFCWSLLVPNATCCFPLGMECKRKGFVNMGVDVGAFSQPYQVPIVNHDGPTPHISSLYKEPQKLQALWILPAKGEATADLPISRSPSNLERLKLHIAKCYFAFKADVSVHWKTSGLLSFQKLYPPPCPVAPSHCWLMGALQVMPLQTLALDIPLILSSSLSQEEVISSIFFKIQYLIWWSLWCG